MKRRTSVEFCAGAGGQALGVERAGFDHLLLVDNDPDCCATLRANRPGWEVVQADMKRFELPDLGKIDLFAAGLPCPPFSIAGKQLGENDERDLFPAALRLIENARPRTIMIENVRGFLGQSFAAYRNRFANALGDLGYGVDWRLYNASDFGVPQSRWRVVIVAARLDVWAHFRFPEHGGTAAPNVGECLADLMGSEGWPGVEAWRRQANRIAPTIVGGSKKHGGPDLGPTRARAAWREMGVNGGSLAENAPSPDFEGMPRLTVPWWRGYRGFPMTGCLSVAKRPLTGRSATRFRHPSRKLLRARSTQR